MSRADAARSVIEPTARSRRIAAALVIAYALVALIPLVWIFMTGFKTPSDAIAYPPKVIFEPSLEGYVNLFTVRSRQTAEYIESLGPPQTWYDELVRKRNMVITGRSRTPPRSFVRFVSSCASCANGGPALPRPSPAGHTAPRLTAA